ncbi:MAG TPA: glucoamylase family protein [Opitutaceae bacterium]
MDRRSFLKTAAGVAGYSLALPTFVQRILPRGDNAFLDDLGQRSFRYFWEQSDPFTGLTRDRSANGRHLEEHRNVASIAATGFGLAALCVGADRGWVEPDEAANRVLNTLDFFANHAPNERGWFYHCMDMRTGERSGFSAGSTRKSELSSMDTALLLGGVLAAKQQFSGDAGIARMADAIYQRVDFRWMLNGNPMLLSHGWTPERGFIRYRWDNYCEHTLLYLLGIASPTSRLDADSWYAWNRPETNYDGGSYIGKAPLFTHQFSHAFIDYRNRREDRGTRTNWFENSVAATRVQRKFCLDISGEFPGYSDRIWGVTSSDSAKGYVAWGGPPSLFAIDGTVVPCAAGGSLMFTPDICVPALRAMHDRFGEKIYGRYGFVDAFHPTNGWVGRDHIGIDVGISLLAAENLRSGNVWKWFMANPEVQRGMERAGLSAA